jgi:hypothetical protein
MAARQGSWSDADKSEWQRQRLQSELARGLHSKTGPVAKFLAGEPMTRNAPTPDESEKPSLTRDEIAQAAEDGKTLTFDGKSSCFADLSWQGGVVDALFQNGYAYSAELDLDDFLDWVADNSVGGYFNEVLGQDFFAPKKTKGE